MEGGSSDGDGDRRSPDGDVDGGGGGGGSSEPKVKRKMKTAAQLEVLEKTYQVSNYPSESLRADLSVQLGLTDRQLQMWFCHRRLKDKKGIPSGSGRRSKKAEASPSTPAAPSPGGTSMPPPSSVCKDEMLGVEMANEHGSGSGSGSSPYGHVDSRRGYVSRPGVAVPRISGHPRYYEPPHQSIAELRAIAFVEAQLGEPLREDGPALGMEFDPLPPGAFGAPIAASSTPQKPSGRSYEAPVYERQVPGRPLHEYQFLPEQPTVRGDSYERVTQSHYYGSPSEGPGTKTPPLSSGRSYVHGYEEVPISYGVPGQMSNLTPQQGKAGTPLSSATGDYDGLTQRSPYVAVGMESPYSAHPITGLDGTPLTSDRRVAADDEAGRNERKRKSEEVRLAKEMEAHEKRMRKELEKQDILRRKREEQMKKEMERQDRERRKEEERLLREKQREEERYQREQRRELERREKNLLKESLRAERMKQKEEVRREREAARQKAANDRAVARKLAKESTELIEDERLELMEIAASRKSLPSILSLDSETLQNLDSFRDMLRIFPPKSVQLMKPFAVQPWKDSEENVGKLLMVWRFLITFTDVLGLWPFTLDEFVQAFHDYDPRLLGEIHVALLKTIIKDIEDVARTPSSGLGLNQNSAANPVGGHPQIVEGAYTWGFDIRSWQQNLSPLTWPEVLRQFALSAGFGPKLKKKSLEQPYSRDDHEGNDGVSVISNLRTGAAVENAVAIMRERGYANPRRSRHRLTPGTVKFAAFHVLSLEGDRGLNILEVADRIQKSGLRDLTTSKTPEASIAAALSRDTKLFERTAPSTYCVRSPYRKDPADAEAILSVAREKVRMFTSGLVEEVEADVDGAEGDDVEKEDSESDTADDPEVDDLGADLILSKDMDPPFEVSTSVPKGRVDNDDKIGSSLGNTMEKTVNGLGNAGGGLSSDVLGSFKELDENECTVEESTNVKGMCREGTSTDHEDTDIDESCTGEPWIEGLVEGEYSNLSVEERLNALVTLIGVANEGNSIRVVLEERLEAANALKKQMWAEAQLDKRRFKEEYLMKTPYATFTPNKSELERSPMLASNDEGSTPHQQQVHVPFNHNNNANADLSSEKNLATPDFSAASENLALQQSVYAERSRAQLKSYIGHKAEEMYVYRSLPLGQDRRRNRYWQFIASASCYDPGTSRIFVELHNGGWRLIDSVEAFEALVASLDVRGIRESHLHALLQKVEPLFKESVRKHKLDNALVGRNDVSVKTEASEDPSNPESSGGTDSPSSTICASSENPELSLSFQVESGKNIHEVKNALRRYRNFEDWMWKESFSSSLIYATKYGKKRCTELVGICVPCRDLYYFEDNHCPTCHKTYTTFDKSFDFSEHMAHCEEVKANIHHSDYPPKIRLLKILLAQLEVYIPPEALQPIWSESYRKSWGMKLHMSSSADDLLQVLTLLEGAIKKDFLSSLFQTTSSWLASGNTVGHVAEDGSFIGTVAVLPWIPLTTSAVALRLMELDSAISYLPGQKADSAKDTETRHFIKLPSKYTIGNVQEDESAAANGEHLEDVWLDGGNDHLGYGSIRGGRGRGRGGRPRGGRSQRRTTGSLGETSSRRGLASTSERAGPVVGGWKNRSSRGKGGRKRGRRSARSRQKPIKKTPAVVSRSNLPEPMVFDKSPPGFSARDEWNVEESQQMQVDEVDVNDDSMSERSEYDDDNVQASGDEYDDMAVDDYVSVYDGKPRHLMGGSGYNMNGDEDDRDEAGEDDEEDDDDQDEVGDEDDDVDDGVQYGQGNLEVGGYLNPESDDEGNRDEYGDRDGDQDDSSDSAATDYSSE